MREASVPISRFTQKKKKIMVKNRTGPKPNRKKPKPKKTESKKTEKKLNRTEISVWFRFWQKTEPFQTEPSPMFWYKLHPHTFGPGLPKAESCIHISV